jgi:hypothetical protein
VNSIYYVIKFDSDLRQVGGISPVSPCPPSHVGTWLCEGGGHGSEAAVSGKLV